MSARVELKYWGGMMKLADKNSEEIDVSSVGDVLNYIQAKYGKAGLKEAKRMLIAVNGTNIQLLDRYKTPLASGDRVSFLPLSAGG